MLHELNPATDFGIYKAELANILFYKQLVAEGRKTCNNKLIQLYYSTSYEYGNASTYLVWLELKQKALTHSSYFVVRYSF